MTFLNAKLRTYIRLILLFMLLANISLAQQGNVYNAHPTTIIDHAGYDQIKGSPYLYKKWYPAKVLGSDGKFYDFEEVNFNGFTHEVETKVDGKIEQIMSRFYIRVVVKSDNNEDTFLRGIHPEFGRNLICVLYDGDEVKFIKRFDVRIEEEVMQTPGVPTKFEKFSVTEQYYLMINGKLSTIKLKKKDITALLSNKSEVDKYLKKEKSNLKSESEVIKLVKYYETL